MSPIPEFVIARVLAKSHPDGACILSDYAPGSHGYSGIGWQKGDQRWTLLCHRVVWIAAHGPIPDGLTVDHLCRNRRCINVDHLRLLTNSANGRSNAQSIRTHCPAGHPYDESNTYRRARGGRVCRACARIGSARQYARRRQVSAEVAA